MSSAALPIQATLDRLRERGADRFNPVRFHVIEALHRRAASQSGEVRRILDERLGKLLAAYNEDLERASSMSEVIDRVAPPCEPAHSALAALLGDIARHVHTEGGTLAESAPTRRSRAYPEMEVLDDFRETWSRVRSERQLRQSLGQAPLNAGPLNSSSLVHRSLSLMREVSPEYLRQFLSYVDALSWLEQMNAGVAPATHDASSGKGDRKHPQRRRR